MSNIFKQFEDKENNTFDSPEEHLEYLKETNQLPFDIDIYPSDDIIYIPYTVNGVEHNVSFSKKQFDVFVHPAKLKYIQAGLGFGKTEIAVRISVLTALRFPGCIGLLISPYLIQAKATTIPKTIAFLDELKADYEYNKSMSEIYIHGYDYIEQEDGTVRRVKRTSILRYRDGFDMDKIRGQEVSFAIIDEINMIKTHTKPNLAFEVFKVTAGRLRFIDELRVSYEYKQTRKINPTTGEREVIRVKSKPLFFKPFLISIGTPYGFNEVSLNFIDNPMPDSAFFHSTTFENPFLSNDYIETTINNYKIGSPFYIQEILALNTSFIGQVYSSFSKDKNITNSSEINEKISKGKITKFVLGKDWGFVNDPGVSLVIGIEQGRTPQDDKYYVMEEFADVGIDVVSDNPQDLTWVKLDREIIMKYKKMGLKFAGIYADTSEVEKYRKFYEKYGMTLNRVDKNIDLGVKSVYRKIDNGNILINEKCNNILIEINNYSRKDDKEDSYIDKYNHSLDALRYVIYSIEKYNN